MFFFWKSGPFSDGELLITCRQQARSYGSFRVSVANVVTTPAVTALSTFCYTEPIQNSRKRLDACSSPGRAYASKTLYIRQIYEGLTLCIIMSHNTKK